jgi:predicted outer membrane repeat protein
MYTKPPFLVFLVLLTGILASCGTVQQDQGPVACDPISLATAITNANSDSDLDEISLDPNCTITFQYPDNQDDVTGINALPLITSPIKIIGNGATLTRGNTTHQFRFFYITGSGNLRIENIQIENGYGLARDDIGGGGAIYNDGGILSVSNGKFISNQGYIGGAIYNSGSLFIENNSEFTGNHSPNNGGAIYLGGSGGIPISISDTTFFENHTLGPDAGAGGAIYIHNTVGDLLVIDDTTFEKNHATTHGGVIYNQSSQMSVHLNDSIIIDNSSDQNGGALYFEGGEMHINHSTLAYNRAWKEENPTPKQYGGSIYLADGSHLITLTRFFEDRAYNGGGSIFNDAGSVVMDTVHINGSSTKQSTWFDPRNYDASGGGIYNNGNLTINKAFIENCDSDYGGGLINRGTATLTNVVFTRNEGIMRGGNIYSGGTTYINFNTVLLGTSHHGSNIYVYGGNTNIKNSIFTEPLQLYDNCVVRGGTLTTLGENIDGWGDCPGFSIQEDPKLFRFFSQLLIALESDSPARDAAIDCTDTGGIPVFTDNRDVSRPQPSDGICDIGATEMEIIPLPPPPEPGILPRLSTPKNLTCRQGDSEAYPAAGYLLEGESAEVIGRNQDGTWLVINNPDWEGDCWLFKGNVELEGDITTTAIITAPPLEPEPDKSGGDTKETGPVCRGDMQKAECEKAGGTFNMSSSPMCKCP